jgi:hypothetical protein
MYVVEGNRGGAVIIAALVEKGDLENLAVLDIPYKVSLGLYYSTYEGTFVKPCMAQRDL